MTGETSDCFVCRKHRGEIEMPGGVLFEDELVYVSHGAMQRDQPAYPGVCFIEPKRHVAAMADLTRVEAERIGWLASLVSRALMNEGAERTYLEVLGHHVPHLHVWIVPRYPGIPAEYVGLQILRWPGAARRWPEVAELCRRLSASVRREIDAASRSSGGGV